MPPRSAAALDFRRFVHDLLADGDAVEIRDQVDPDLEVGAISRRVYETRSPAPLFTTLKDGGMPARILGAPAGLSRDPHTCRRIAAHLGLPPSARPREIVETLAAAIHATPLPPVEVARDAAPAKQNTWHGSEVDLRRFPVPLLHQEDGGRFLGTYGFHVVRSPDGEWTSWSIARTMLHGRNTVVGPAIASQHIGMIHRQWQDRGEPMPWAMVLGAPPAALLAAGMPLAEGVDEGGYAGALAGAPIEVVRAETSDLLVPANAEIVLEGRVVPGETAPEGPMGEYHGYVFPEVKEKPVFRVDAVTFRDDPILPVCTAGLPPEENHTIWGPLVSATALDTLRRAGLPVDFAWVPFEAAGCWLVVSTDLAALAARNTTEERFAADVAAALYPTHGGGLVPKVILVGDDIDITDVDQVVWAVATRQHPRTGHHLFPAAPTFPLVPYLTGAESAAGHGGNAVISALFPEQYRGRTTARTASFATSYPAEVRDRVLANWTHYGYPA